MFPNLTEIDCTLAFVDGGKCMNVFIEQAAYWLLVTVTGPDSLL